MHYGILPDENDLQEMGDQQRREGAGIEGYPGDTNATAMEIRRANIEKGLKTVVYAVAGTLAFAAVMYAGSELYQVITGCFDTNCLAGTIHIGEPTLPFSGKPVMDVLSTFGQGH